MNRPSVQNDIESVFVVQHVHEFDDQTENVKFIGVYSSREKARAAVTRLQSQPGFCDTKEGFEIEEYEIDKDHWTEGFVTMY